MSRRIVTSAMLLTSTLCLVTMFTPATPLLAADTKQETALKKQVTDLQKELQQASTIVNNLKQEIAQGTAKVNQLQADLKKAKADDTTDTKSIKSLSVQLDHMKGARYVHTMVYTLKSDSSSSEVQSMMDDVNTLLSKVKTVRGIWVGKPVKGDADSENQVAFTMLFDDAAGYKVFIADPQTKKFTEKHSKLWESPTKVDFVVPVK